MNSRWQANKIGLIDFWYYDEQEFPFVKGRMLLRGANGSGKSVTMQSVVPLLLDGNMSPERLDPFGSRDRKMSSYLLEDDDGREERTGYLYLEFKRRDSETYLTIGMGIRARRGKNLDKWYFSLTDGRRIGKDFFLYRQTGEKITLSKRELENRIGDGGRLIERQADYMEYVNKQIFGFETVEEYKEMVDLLIQLRTPKLSKDFKPSVINDILSDSLQALSDEDLRPMSEAIENMDAMNMNLKSRREARQAADKINTVFSRYNRKLLYDKADALEQVKSSLNQASADKKAQERRLSDCRRRIDELDVQLQQMDAQKASLEKEKESLNKSDAVALKERETQLEARLQENEKTLSEKQGFIEAKQEQYTEAEVRIRAEEDRKYEKEKEISALLEEMQYEADVMSFDEHAFMEAEFRKHMEEPYAFDSHQGQFDSVKKRIDEGTDILAQTDAMERRREELLKERDGCIRRLDTLQRKAAELENILIQAQNEWKEALYLWNGSNSELQLEKEMLSEISRFADTYDENSDFADVRGRVADIWIKCRTHLESQIAAKQAEIKEIETDLADIRKELAEWENMKEPQPEQTEAVIRSRKRLDEMGIPYREFYKVIEFAAGTDETACNRLEEALLRMGVLDALVIEEQYREQVLQHAGGCEDNYLFAGKPASGRSLLDVLELNDEYNDLFTGQRFSNILGCIAYGDDDIVSVAEDGTYRSGILTGTVTGEYEARFIGTKAREKHRLAMIESCRSRITELEKHIELLEAEKDNFVQRGTILEDEYSRLPDDADMREAYRMLKAGEAECTQQKREIEKLEEQIGALTETLKEKKKAALEIAEALYLTCSYDVFRDAGKAAEAYGRHLVGLKAAHEMLGRCIGYLNDRRRHLEELDDDMEQIRYDISVTEREIRRRSEELTSVRKQLELTDYEEIRERLDECISWLAAYPDMLSECVSSSTHEKDEAQQLEKELEKTHIRIETCEKRMTYFADCYEQERKLDYVPLPEEIPDDSAHVRDYLETDVKGLDKNRIVSDLNRVYFENRGALTDYQLMQHELFADAGPDDSQGSSQELAEKDSGDVNGDFAAGRIDISARYQGVKISFFKLLTHLEEDIAELENLIKDGDRELFEDILANTVSRKIRGRINASNAWVSKMNQLMNSMNTSSGLKLSLRWRSRTAEQEDQLDTKELVDLLKKDYRLMSEEEAAKLSSHFRSKVEQARRNARDSSGMVSFYQIMKDTLDYRKWFEFQLFSQKSGERQKELTNSVFGTFSGGEKAMAMYVPLFSAVVAKYQGGRSDAPRLISLDEAFAGVDNRNIRDMFRLMTEFEFDFIINSQVLWGDCDTLDALAIYQLIRSQNAKFVTVMPYLWNGRRKELMENEESMEVRGAELEQSSVN